MTDLAWKSFWQESGIVGLLESLKGHIMTAFDDKFIRVTMSQSIRNFWINDDENHREKAM
jgi:hypothetical protein